MSGPYLEPSPKAFDKGNLVGVCPSKISLQDLLKLGHPQSPIKAIRAYCLTCCYDQSGEVAKCTCLTCPLWAFRKGKNVFHKQARQVLDKSLAATTPPNPKK